jgi:hypothetical protein
MNDKRVTPRHEVRASIGRRVLFPCCVLLAVAAVPSQFAQTSGGFAPGARELFSTNFAQDALGEFPKSLRHLSGSMQIVEKDGKRMLRASSRSEFLITLPERLPDRFTLEADLITRAAGNNSDEFAFEGTPTMNRSSASAHVMWNQSVAHVQGGGRDAANGYVQMPDDVQAEIEGQLAEIRVEFAGDDFKFYVNGRRILSFPDMKFVRARVMRILLNGIDDKQLAVHLVRLRIADATTTAPTTAQQQSGMVATSTNSPSGGGGSTTMPTHTATSAGTGSNIMTPSSTATTGITGLKLTIAANGAATLTWNPLSVAAEYFVVRWNATDPSCCNAMSPPGIPLTSPVWQDGVLPVAGSYAYRVIGRTATGTVEGQAQFTYGGGAPTPPPGVAYAPPPAPAPTAVLTTVPTGGSITPMPAPTSGGTSTTIAGTSGGGTIIAPEPPPPTSPYSSIPRTVSVMPTSTTTTTSDPANPNSGATSGGTSTTSGTLMALPAQMTGTGMVMTAPTGGTGAPANPRYRVMLTGFAVAKVTVDDPLADGRGDEVYAAAAVLNWDRLNLKVNSFDFVRSREYGDVNVAALFPNRIQAGSASDKGGLVAGDRVPSNYDIGGANIPATQSDQFPLLLWEGELPLGNATLVIVPSLWERDPIQKHFDSYKNNWSSVSKREVVESAVVARQFTSTTLTSGLAEPDAISIAAPPTPSFLGAPAKGYKIATLALPPGSDRPIGMTMGPGVMMYRDRFVVITREKVNTLNAGDGITITLPLAEPIDPLLSGIYSLNLRVQRLQ